MEKQIDLDRHATKNEARIARRIVSDALAAGYVVSVCDDYSGEGEWTVKKSSDRDVILAALASTGGDVLRFRKADGERVGVVSLIWGNDCDLISDYSDNEAMAALLKGAQDLADKLQG